MIALHPLVDIMAFIQALFTLQGLPHGPSPHFAEFTIAGLITAGLTYSIFLSPSRLIGILY